MDSISRPELVSIIITLDQCEQMLFHVRMHNDEESCGLLGGMSSTVEKVYPITNDLHSSTRFRMNGTEQVDAFTDIEQNGWDLLAIYHSHLHGPCKPSETDSREFAYPGVAYLIFDLSTDDVLLRGFRMVSGEWIEIPVVITPQEQLP